MKMILEISESTMYGSVSNPNKEIKEIDVPNNLNVKDWNNSLTTALGRNPNFSNWTLANLNAGMIVVTSDANYALSKPKNQEGH